MNPTSDHTHAVYDLLAVGCGPFNLGLAALSSTLRDLSFVALEAGSSDFRWHPGLMLEDAMMQVSFLADLVTLVEPTHPLSFLNYLKDKDRLYPFYIREQFHSTRREYEDYLRWAGQTLTNIRYHHRVSAIRWDGDNQHFVIDVEVEGQSSQVFRAKHIALGIGTEPFTPDCFSKLGKSACVHSGAYLLRLPEVLASQRVTVIGSGQSGAEVTLDLLRRGVHTPSGLGWFTRTEAFTPLDYSKLVLEMTTPDYVDYFHSLPETQRYRLVKEQWRHYKGISSSTLELLHDHLYAQVVETGEPGIELRCGVAVLAAEETANGVTLQCKHQDTGAVFEHETDLVITATGYHHRQTTFLDQLTPLLCRDQKGNPVIRRDHAIETTRPIPGKVFVSNADLHSHGVAAPDLGICAVRNATIINSVMGQEIYRLPKRTAFTQFIHPGAGHKVEAQGLSSHHPNAHHPAQESP